MLLYILLTDTKESRDPDVGTEISPSRSLCYSEPAQSLQQAPFLSLSRSTFNGKYQFEEEQYNAFPLSFGTVLQVEVEIGGIIHTLTLGTATISAHNLFINFPPAWTHPPISSNTSIYSIYPDDPFHLSISSSSCIVMQPLIHCDPTLKCVKHSATLVCIQTHLQTTDMVELMNVKSKHEKSGNLIDFHFLCPASKEYFPTPPACASDYQATVYAAGGLVVDVRKVVRRTFNFTPRNPRGRIGLTANRLGRDPRLKLSLQRSPYPPECLPWLDILAAIFPR